MKSDLRRISSAYGAFPVTVPGEGAESLPRGTRQIFVGGGGNLVVQLAEGPEVTYALADGQWVDIQAVSISSDTTCTGIIAHT